MSHTDEAYAALLLMIREQGSSATVQLADRIEATRARTCKADNESPEFDTCEECQTLADEEQGRWTDAGFECETCESARHEEGRREFLRAGGLAGHRQRARDTAHAAAQAADPAGYYISCKDHPETLDHLG